MYRTGPRAHGAALVLAVLLLATTASGCGSAVSPTARSSAPRGSSAPSLSADTKSAAEHYFGPIGAMDVELGNRSIAYWLVETQTTPTVDTASATLLYMAQRYGNQNRAIVLRMDKPHPGTRGATDNLTLLWNPTHRTSSTGLVPPDQLPRESLAVVAGVDPGQGLGLPIISFTTSDVVTATLSPGDSPRQQALRRLLQASGLQ